MTTALDKPPVSSPSPDILERVLIKRDTSGLPSSQKVQFLLKLCDSLGLNPLTAPFEFIKLPDGREVPYLRRDGADQLRKLHSVSIDPNPTVQYMDGLIIVTVTARLPNGRTDTDSGAVFLDTLKGQNRANAVMTAMTKAKRRVTQGICGLGFLDESEIESIPGAVVQASPVLAPDTGVVPSIPNGDDSDSGSAPADAPSPAGVPVHAGFQVNSRGEEIPRDGKLYVARVDRTQTRNANVTRCTITLSDGSQATTIANKFAKEADWCLDALVPVVVETKGTQWGREITLLARDLVPKDGDDIPF
jgi:hypothetical protein